MCMCVHIKIVYNAFISGFSYRNACNFPHFCHTYAHVFTQTHYTHAYTYVNAHTYTLAHSQGEAVIIPAYPESQDLSQLNLDSSDNEGKPIRFLISAPTMRIPTNVSKTVNAYLAFRAILRAGTTILDSGNIWLVTIQ